jgi:hypothetical protein
VRWGYDTEYLAPETAISGICHQTCVNYTTSNPPVDIFGLDAPIYYSTPVWDSGRPGSAVFSNGMMFYVAASPGTQIGGAQTVTVAGSITSISLEVSASDVGHDSLGAPTEFTLIVQKNGATAASIVFAPTPKAVATEDFRLDTAVSISADLGDVFTCFIQSPVITTLVWTGVLVTAGHELSWSPSTLIPDGDYYAYREL